ncbi:PLP-dependent aminotransferase family protein [Aquimarina aggregata]|uniref:MocR-like pyridoxine biosynthesis transcription factor PdxR n=1 Tax=Aquimarina aggregata TaxID=1642818 RepID=UPI002491613B|nr:PLP-dependent aminotransferase family protein [Aquimarina aggregata]
MFPFKNNITLERKNNRNLYLQICDQIIGFIKSGQLPPSAKLPSSRKLSEDLNVHRKTIIAAYDELIAQGWVETLPAKGTYIKSSLPVIKQQSFGKNSLQTNSKTKSNFSFIHRPHLIRKEQKIDSLELRIDDGVPDNRLAPIEEIAKTYRNITKRAYYTKLLGYDSIYGNLELRKTLVNYLNETRGLNISLNNILITRGTQMGMYLAGQLLLNDTTNRIIVGTTNYMTSDNTFTEAGGIIERVPVDENGLDTNVIENICERKKIKAIYVTSHHHHPTTVTLSAKRRMHLLQLAKKYNFAIIEDDYDYDFHYSNSPILPLASNDNYGNVIYIGGFTKIIAPAMRIGYMIAPKDFIDEAARLRRIIDRQGDMILEQTMARMIISGDIQRHSKKALKIYKTRRDLFCALLKEKLGNYFDFQIPKGGMAVWVLLNKKYNWNTVISKAQLLNLEFNAEWKRYDNDNSGHNGIRFGFASLNEEEIHEVIHRLSKIMKSINC